MPSMHHTRLSVALFLLHLFVLSALSRNTVLSPSQDSLSSHSSDSSSSSSSSSNFNSQQEHSDDDLNAITAVIENRSLVGIRQLRQGVYTEQQQEQLVNAITMPVLDLSRTCTSTTSGTGSSAETERVHLHQRPESRWSFEDFSLLLARLENQGYEEESIQTEQGGDLQREEDEDKNEDGIENEVRSPLLPSNSRTSIHTFSDGEESAFSDGISLLTSDTPLSQRQQSQPLQQLTTPTDIRRSSRRDDVAGLRVNFDEGTGRFCTQQSPMQMEEGRGGPDAGVGCTDMVENQVALEGVFPHLSVELRRHAIPMFLVAILLALYPTADLVEGVTGFDAESVRVFAGLSSIICAVGTSVWLQLARMYFQRR